MTLLGGTLFGGAGALEGATARLDAFRRVQQQTVVLYFDFAGAVAGTRVFELRDPERLVIDLPATALGGNLARTRFPDGVVSAVRYGTQTDGSLRVVVDLRRGVEATHRFVPHRGGQRLLVDLGVRGDLGRARGSHRKVEQAPLRDVVVAIDPGHGGKDPGAIGQRESREKDIVLSVARRLEARLGASPGLRPLMIRSDDTYVGLRQRVGRAREHRADLFVSVHADAVPRREAKGGHEA